MALALRSKVSVSSARAGER